jgi:hypothetical protein
MFRQTPSGPTDTQTPEPDAAGEDGAAAGAVAGGGAAVVGSKQGQSAGVTCAHPPVRLPG